MDKKTFYVIVLLISLFITLFFGCKKSNPASAPGAPASIETATATESAVVSTGTATKTLTLTATPTISMTASSTSTITPTGSATATLTPVPTPNPTMQMVVDANVIALWHFDETSGQILHDSSSKGNDLTLGANSSISTDDPSIAASDNTGFGNCLLFNKSNSQYCFLGKIVNLPAHSFSVEFWMKASSNNNDQFLFGDDSLDLQLWMTAGHRIEMNVGDGSNWTTCDAADPVVDDGIWHYIACTYDYGSTTANIYIDGVDVYNNTAVSRATPRFYDFNVGGRPYNTFFDGYMDEVRVSNIARTAAEISGYYNRAH